MYGVGEEVGVDQDGVGGDERVVVREEEGRGDLGDFADDLGGRFLLGDELGFGLVLFSKESYEYTDNRERATLESVIRFQR